MNDALTSAEIRLEKAEPRFARLVFGGLASLILWWGLAQFAAFALNHEPADAGTLVLLMLGIWLLYRSIFSSDVAWSIGNKKIRIDRKRPFGRTRTEIIKGGETIGMRVLNNHDEGAASFSVEFQLLPTES